VLKELIPTASFEIYPADVLAKIKIPNPSDKVFEVTGCYGVAESSAKAANIHGMLVVEKQKGTYTNDGKISHYTYAIAEDKSFQRKGHIEIVGAGPGDPELVSVRGRKFLETADLILYAGSLVPRQLTNCAKHGATVRSSADMNLEEQFALMKEFYDKGKLVVTKVGKTMVGNPAKLLPVVMHALCTDFYMGYFDGFPEELDSLTYGAAALYVSLHKFGDEFRPTSFYKDEYMQFFAEDWSRFDKRREYIEWSDLTSCIRARIFERHLQQLGLVEIKPFHYPEQRESEVKRTPLFDKLIGVRISRNEAMKTSGKIYS